MSDNPPTPAFDLKPFYQILQLLGRDQPDSFLRLGRFRAGRTFETLPTTNVESVRIIPVLAANGENLYFEVNESAYHDIRGRSKEEHITRLTCVWADLDYKGESGPGKRKGLGSEQAVLDTIDELSRLLGVPPAAIIYSGNGMQPLWPISDGGIEHGVNDVAVKLLLKRWGVLVRQVAQNLGGDADGIFDLPRVLRIPGPPNVKNPDEPKPTKAVFPDGNQPFEVEELRELLDDLGIVYSDDVTIGLEPVSKMSEWEWADHDCQFVDQVRDWMLTEEPNARHQWGLKTASVIQGLIRYGCVTEETFYQLRTEFLERFTFICENVEPRREVARGEIPQMWSWAQARAEAWTVEKLVDEMRGHSHMVEALSQQVAAESVERFDGPDPFVPPPLPPGIAPEQPPAAPEPPKPVVLELSTTEGLKAALADVLPPSDDISASHRTLTRLGQGKFSDIGNAERLANVLQKRYIYVPMRGFHVWQNGRWQPDAGGTHVEASKDVMMSMLATATTPQQEKWAHKSLNAGPLKAAINLAQTTEQLMVPLGQLDSNPYELCTPGGVVDIRTGQIRPGDPKRDRHTLSTAVTPDFSASAPMFEEWILWALDTPERVQYVQRLLGIACIGALLAHVFPMFIGPGGNGKTTLLQIGIGVLGQYGKTMQPKFLVEKRTEQHPTEIANLQGVRLAIASEVPAKSSFDEDLVKTISGEPVLSGRFMRQDFIQFQNTTTLFLAANHLPRVRYGGRSWWRRTRKIDFNNVALVEDRDLPDRIIQQEGPAVLAWMIRGAMDYLAHGEQPPLEVLAATMEYEREEDSLLRFIEQHYTFTEGVTVQRDMLYGQYEIWSSRNRLEVLSSTQFYREVLTRWSKLGDAGDQVFIGIAPKNWVDEEVPA